MAEAPVDARSADAHPVDYFDTFITIAPDWSADAGMAPVVKDGAAPTIASRQYAMVADHPYEHTSGGVIFAVWADRREIPSRDRPAARAEYYSKGQACLRSSDLGKRWGWGIHADAAGRIAVYGVDSPEYQAFASGVSPFDGTPVTVTPAMRSSRR